MSRGPAVRAVILTAGLGLPIACATPRENVSPLPPLAVDAIGAPAAIDPGGVQLSSAAGRTILTWTERDSTGAAVKFSESVGSGWSAPQVVVTGTQVLVNVADVPSVHPLPNGHLVAQWLEQNGTDPEAYDLRIASASDGGRSWTAHVTPHDDATKTQHGFASIVEEPEGGFEIIWIDGRNSDVGLLGAMDLRAATYSNALAQVQQTVVDRRVCECCQTSAVTTADGPVVAFRNRSDQEVRDVQLARRTDTGWSKPVTVHEDGWLIDGCPVNGPALAAQGSVVAVAWFTAPRNPGHAFLAFSEDSGRTFGRPIQLDDTQSIGRVQVALLDDGTAAATWVETGQDGQVFKVRRVDPRGRRSDAATIGRPSGQHYPRMARHGRTLLFAWIERSDGRSRLRTSQVGF